MYYTYFHTRKDNGKIFYVGAGSLKRAKATGRRNPEWKAIAKGVGYSWELVGRWETFEEATLHEELLIVCLKDLNHPLVNIAIGGHRGITPSVETRSLRSQSLKGKPHTKERKLNMSINWKTRKRYCCLGCGLITYPGQLTQHQLKTGHSERSLYEKN